MVSVLQVFNRYLQPGGEEKSVARMASDLEAAGHQVARFWKASAEWKEPGAPARLRQPFLLWNNGAVLKELRQLHEKVKPDVWLLHNVVPVISLGVYRLARELGVPILQWLHNYRPISPSGTLTAGSIQLQPDDPRVYWKESRSGSWNGRFLTAWLALGYARIRRRGDFSSVRAWVTVGDEMKAIFQRAGWYPDRLHSLRHSWNIQPAPASYEDAGHFLFLGRMVETKGVRFLIDLWRDPALQKVRLVMAGQGTLADELRDTAPPMVRWVGHIEGDAKERLIATCRAIVFPCTWPEPLSTVAYEAYERCKPILASNLGGMKEVVRERETGRLIEPADHSAWLEAVQGLDAAESRRLGQNGRRWLEENVAPAVWVQKFKAIAREAMAGGSGRAATAPSAYQRSPR